jgi:hypothetical protein
VDALALTAAMTLKAVDHEPVGNRPLRKQYRRRFVT